MVNEKAKAFYQRHGVADIEPGVDLQEEFRGTILMHTRYCLKFEFGLCRGKEDGGTDTVPLFLTNGKEKYRCEFDCASCTMRIIDSFPRESTR